MGQKIVNKRPLVSDMLFFGNGKAPVRHVLSQPIVPPVATWWARSLASPTPRAAPGSVLASEKQLQDCSEKKTSVRTGKTGPTQRAQVLKKQHNMHICANSHW